MKINLVTKSIESTSASKKYTGTKVSDLAKYIKGLVPDAKFSKPGPGARKVGSGRMLGYPDLDTAKEIVAKLKAAGWKVRKVKPKKRPQDEKARPSYTSFSPPNPDDFPSYPPYVMMYGQLRGKDTRIQFVLSHMTNAAHNEIRRAGDRKRGYSIKVT